MYNSLSNIQKHLYSLIQQNNPEYLQQSINEEYRSRRRNLANTNPDQGPLENPSDFEGMDQIAADRLRARRIAGTGIRDTNAAKADPVKDAAKNLKTVTYYKNLIGTLPSNPNDYTEQQAAEVAMMKTISKTNVSLQDDPFRPYTNISSDKLANLSVKTNQNNPSPSSQSRMALRYQKKAQENALPYGDRPISPFYKTTRNQFQNEFGRDFDTSGGANTSNMRALVNNQTNLGGKLTDIEKGWQDARSEQAQAEACEGESCPANAMVKAYTAARDSDKRNPVNIYKPSDFDVPPSGTPGRELPTKETDSGRQSGLIHQGMWHHLNINPDQVNVSGLGKNLDAYGLISRKQTLDMGLTGKQVNQKLTF